MMQYGNESKSSKFRVYLIDQKKGLERTAGIEPASSAWKAEVIAIIRSTQIVGRCLGSNWSVQRESNPHHQLGRLR